MTSFNQRLSCVFFRRVFTTLEAHSREQYRRCWDSNHRKFAQMAATLASHQLDTQFRTLLILYMSETIGFLWVFRPSCRLSSASRKTKKTSQLSSLWATQDILLLSCTVAGAKHGSRQLLGMKQVYTCLTFFWGELYLKLFELSFPARDPPFSGVGFALKTKKPVNTGVFKWGFKYMAKPAKGRTIKTASTCWPWLTNEPPTIQLLPRGMAIFLESLACGLLGDCFLQIQGFHITVIYQNHKTGSMAFVQSGMKWKKGTSRRLEKIAWIWVCSRNLWNRNWVHFPKMNSMQHTFLKLVLGKL